MNRLLARVAGIETRAAQITHPDRVPSDALALRTGNRDQPQYPRQNADNATEWGYEASLYSYRCVNTIASTIASLPWCAAGKPGGTPDKTSVLAQLLGPAPGGPNTYWSSALAWKYAVIQWLIQGRWSWLKQYVDDQLVGLFPLQVQGLNPVPAVSGNAPFDRFEYLRGTPYYTDFQPKDLVYCWNPHQADWRQAESPLYAASRTINTFKLLEDFDTSFLVNGGVPAYLITSPAFAAKDDRARFRSQFQKFQGAANAGQVMFAERQFDPGESGSATPDPVKIDTIGLSQRDSEMSSLRDQKVRDVCVAWGVPLSLLADSSLTRFHQTAEDRQTYMVETIKPLLQSLADQVNIALGAELDEYGWFDSSSIRELSRERVFTNDATAVVLVTSNLISRDEWRADAGLPPAKEAGITEPVQVQTTERITDPVAKQPSGGEQPSLNGSAPASPAPPAKAAPALAGAAARAQVIDIRALAAARRGNVTSSISDEGTNVPLDRQESTSGLLRHAGPDGHAHGIPSGHVTLATLQQAFTTKLRRYLAAQQDAVGKRLSGRRNRTVRAAMVRNVEALLDVGYWITEGQRVFPEHADLIRTAVLQTAADLADAIRAEASDDQLLAVIENSVKHYQVPAA